MLNEAGIPKLLDRELVRAVRAKRSQEAIRRRLGATYNLVSRWETGKSEASWSDFAKLCAACKVEPPQLLSAVLSYDGPVTPAAGLVRHLQGALPVVELCRATGVSRSTWSRWVLGRAEPTLREVLTIMSVNRGILAAFF